MIFKFIKYCPKDYKNISIHVQIKDIKIQTNCLAFKSVKGG